MTERISKRRGGDNTLEDYFLELVIKKHIIDREIHDIIDIVEKSLLHSEYQILLKRILFGEKNIYIEHWGTLEGSLLDLMKTGELRSNHISGHGVILELMIDIIESVFNIEDDLFYEFRLSHKKEDIEHQLIILLKRILDFCQQGLQGLISQADHLDEPVQGHIRKEFSVIQQTLLKYPEVILSEQKTHIEYLKNEVEKVRTDLISQKKNMNRVNMSV